jgi:microcystin synthetase protein McyA
MEKVIAELMQRNAVLRTSFAIGKYTVPLQMVHTSVKVPLWVEDLRHLSSDEQAQALAEWENAQKKRRFDVMNPPLFCIHVHLRSDETFQLGIVEHHAILDGWSVAVLQAELLSSYSAEIQGRPEKPEKAVKDVFRTYVQLEQQALQSTVSSSYWQTQLNGAQRLNLVRRFDQEGAAETAYRTKISLPQNLGNKLKQAARLAGVPMKSILLAAHMRVLSTLSGQRDILTGLVMHGRPEMQDADHALGLFLNTLPLRLQLEDCSWLELAQKSFHAEREMLPHRFYPMASIVQQTGSAPLETLFNFVHFQVLDKMDIAPIEIVGRSAFAHTEFALVVNCSQSNNGLDITLLFQPAYFSPNRAQEITAYYQTAVTAICEDPEQKHESCSLLSQRELQHVLTEWNNTEAEYPAKCLHQFFEEQTTKTAHSIAIECRGARLTYEELNRQANAIAKRLRDRSVGPEVRVGVCLERGLALISTLLGVLKAGGAYVALDPAYPQSRLQYVIDDSQIQLIVTQDDLAGRFSNISTPIVKIKQEQEIAGIHFENPETKLTGSNLAYVIYTSGSTGQPKGAAITHNSAATLMYWARSVFEAEELQGVCAGTSVSFDLSVFEIFAPLSWGGKVILAGNTLELAEVATDSEVRLINTVPSVMAELLRNQILPATVQTVNLAGEALSQELVEELYKYPNVKRVWDLYGPSEDTTYSTYALRKLGGKPTIGRPIANTRVYVLNEVMQLQPVGVAGELYIGGSGLARGYLGKPELTAERFVPDPFDRKAGGRLYRTGDLARWNEEGNLEYLGRMDGQVKIRGYRIECGEVESALRQCPGVKTAVVSLRGDGDDKRLAAYLVADDPCRLEIDSIRSLLREKLPEFMIPSWIIVLKSLPLNSNGKIDHKALPETHFETIDEKRQKHEAPANPTEELVAAIWAEVLKIERVGRRDDFFELGGHSLLAMQVVARTRNVFREAVPLNSLFEASVLADFVSQLTLKQKKPGRLEKIARIFLAGSEQKEAVTGACL